MSRYGNRRNPKYGLLFPFNFYQNKIEVGERNLYQSFILDDAVFAKFHFFLTLTRLQLVIRIRFCERDGRANPLLWLCGENATIKIGNRQPDLSQMII